MASPVLTRWSFVTARHWSYSCKRWRKYCIDRVFPCRCIPALAGCLGLGGEGRKQFSPNRLLRGLDQLRTEHLPTRLDAAARLHFECDEWVDRIHARSVLAALEKALKQIDQSPLSDGLKFLQITFESREFIDGRRRYVGLGGSESVYGTVG